MRDSYRLSLSFPNGSFSGGVLGLVLIISGLITACGKQEPAANGDAPPAVPVRIQTLNAATVQDTSEFVGALEAVQKATLKAQIQGPVEQIAVQPGDLVGRGTFILALQSDKTTFQVASVQAQINQARASRAAEMQQLKVQKARLATTQSQYKLAQSTYDRFKYVAQEGGYSQYELDKRRLELEMARDGLRAAEEQVRISQDRIVEAEADVRRFEADAASANVDVQYKQVTAPITGVVGDLPVKVGDYVSTGDTVGSVTRNDVLDLRMSIPSTRLGQLRQGIPVILIDPNTNKTLTTGQINFVAPNVDSNAQMVLTKARFANPNQTLRDGQYVQARVLWNQKPGVLIPTTAITRTGSKSFVFVAETATEQGQPAKQVARQRPVELGEIQGSSYQVISGLKPGDHVATTNIQKLRDGAPIQPKS